MRKLMTACRLLVIAPLLIGISAAAVQAESPGEACDRLAAHPGDPTRPANIKGVATGAIDTKAALAACTAAVAADPGNARYHLQLGRTFYDMNSYEKAFHEFEIASKAGSMAATGVLGYLYGAGLGVARDKNKGIEFSTRAAEANIAFAAHNLGVDYRDNDGVPVDYEKSLRYFRQAAALGYDKSLADIGYAYENGYAVTVDYQEAMRWYQQAAAKGVDVAFNNIGNLYESGNGVPQDYAKAMEWYVKAKDTDYTLAYMNIANLYQQGLGVKADPDAAVDMVLKAFELGGAGDDAFNRDYLIEDFKSPAFWQAFQNRLVEKGKLTSQPDGKLNADTRAAIEAIIDK